MLRKMIDKIFAMEEINGDEVCPTYLYRWRIVSLLGYKVYLHHFVGDDWSREMHDHPRRFISIGIRGRYVEETPLGSREFRAPWFRSFPAEHIHRIRLLPDFQCWTLVIVCRITRHWGFWHKGTWMPWKQYVYGPGKSMKSCE